MPKVLETIKTQLVCLEERESALVWVSRCIRHPQSFYPVTQSGVYRGVIFNRDLLQSWLSAFPAKEFDGPAGFCYLDRPKLENFLLSLRKLMRTDILSVGIHEDLSKAAGRIAAKGLSETTALDPAGRVAGKFELSAALTLLLREEFDVFAAGTETELTRASVVEKPDPRSSWAGRDRRVFPRIPIDLPARVESALNPAKPVEAAERKAAAFPKGPAGEVRIRDLSAGGARLRTLNAVREGELCFLHFSPDGMQELMCLSKVLSNREIPGESLPVESRVMFMTMESADRRRIERLILEGDQENSSRRI